MRSLGFTAQERKVIIFLLVIIASGTCVQIYKKKHPSFLYSASERAKRDSLVREFNALTITSMKDSAASKGETRGASTAVEKEGAIAGIDINTATEDELQSLPSIGPVLARRILQYRAQHGRFKSPEEITKVKGIGEKIYAQIKHLIRA